MDIWRRSSSIGTLLPMWNTSPQAQSSTQDDTTTEKPTQKSSLFRGLTKINTKIQRYPSDALVMSPTVTTSSPVEVTEVDGTFDQMVPAEQSKTNKNEKQKLTDKTLFEEEKPGEGNVWDVWARMPKHARRWEKPANIPVAHVPIPAGSLGITRPVEPLPEGWTMHIHPEGKPYYHRDARDPEPTLLLGTNLYDKGKDLCRPLEIVTDSDPRDPITRKTLEHAHFIARITIAENDVELPDRVELFLELYPAEEEDIHPYAGYYLADHDNQTVFWGAPTSTSSMGALRVNPETFSDQHLKLQLSQQYWAHVEMYPMDTSLDLPVATTNLREHLSFMYLDVATSHTSTAPWTESQCQSFLSILNQCPSGRQTWMVARLTSLMMDWQFQNLFGHPAARLDRTHSYEVEVPPVMIKEDSKSESTVSEAPTPPTLRDRMGTVYHAAVAVLLRICCILLFDAPAAHNEALEKVWVDKIVHKVRFQELLDRTVKDWGDVSLLSTVLWTANMAFLAIPYPILDPQLQDPVTDFEQTVRIGMITTSLMSTIFSVGSIAISLLHIRKHRTERSAQEYCDFLESEHHDLYGHRPLAMLWSLPYAFLMWSVLSFSAAIILFCITATGLISEVTLLTLTACMVFWIILSIWYFWKRETRWTSTVEGVQRPSFRMLFTNWFWDLRMNTPARRL